MAASGGYMMACVADKILAAPFSIVGSIGVLAQIPNFNKILKKNDRDYEQITAGDYKRTLTLFGENTEEGKKKFQEQIQQTHNLFKKHVKTNRPQLDIDKVANGEHWLATEAIDINLVDELMTSDDYLLQLSEKAKIIEVKFKDKKKTIKDKLMVSIDEIKQKIVAPHFFS